MAKRQARPEIAISSAPDGAVVTIRAKPREKVIEAKVIEAKVARDARLLRLAEEWSYVLRSRARWVDDEEIRLSFRERALSALEEAGVSRAFMKKLASASRVEVELHPWDVTDPDINGIHEAAAEVPWEYLISAATRGVGRYRSLLITRLFRNQTAPAARVSPQTVLFVESAPGRVEDVYDFYSERIRIGAAVGAGKPSDGAETVGSTDTGSDGSESISGAETGSAGSNTSPRTMETAETESLSELRATVHGGAWDVLHVTGIDTHQAAWLFKGFYGTGAMNPAVRKSIVDSDGRVRDGMILREANVAELPVSYEELATVLVNPMTPPLLITLNLYFSGARTARELVRKGAHAALGFLDEIDDELAEAFFQALYWAWCRPAGTCDIRGAFLSAWEQMRGNNLHGTAIVIWTGRSVFEQADPVEAGEESQQAEAEAPLRSVTGIPMSEILQVDLEVPSEINYSLLHNDCPLLHKLTLTKLITEPLGDITVQVELNVGATTYPYRCTRLVLEEPQVALAPIVCIPLTAALPRALRERVQSTVYVKVCCGGRTAIETTERVTLIPVDEWVDDTTNNPWLPSFVLPRDPAILKIINASRRYLIGITDSPAVGFDGYQSDEQGVDAQVQAVWTAIVNEYRLQYINPPPAYSKRNQRLRTPSDIVASNTGTCIDLALLLASCLEYIEVYPVLVLLEGHAFPGYWRSEEAYASFVEVLRVPDDVPAPGSALARSAAVRFVDQYGWRLTRLHYDEIMAYVRSGDLVMLEATYLASASSFSESIAAGRSNMKRREFDSLLDIRLARTATPPVTPLPIMSD